MPHDLIRAKQLLSEKHYTCVVCRGDTVFADTRRGIRPLLEWVQQNQSLQGFSAADKVVGKAAALLYCLLQVRRVHAHVLSRPAEEVLRRHGIEVYYDLLTDAIHNRTGDGYCPMETAVWEVHDPGLAPEILQAALNKLS